MTAYLVVYGKDPTDRFAALAYPTWEAARRASLTLVPSVPVDGSGNYAPDKPTRPGIGGCHCIIEKDKDVPLNGPTMAAVYNALTGCSIKKFESRATGTQRVMKALAEHATPTQSPEENKVSDTTTNGAAPGKRGRKSQFAEDAHITVVKMGVRESGKNAHRYTSITDGATVAEALAGGALSGDLSYAVKRGWVTIA